MASAGGTAGDFSKGFFIIEHVGEVGSCDFAPNIYSWDITPNIHYRSIDGNLWVAWRVPPTIGTSNFLNVQAAQLIGGSAGIDLDCFNEAQNGTCVAGKNTSFTT